MQCQTLSGFKPHDARYSGFGKNHCNECHCRYGSETCTKRQCGLPGGAKLCDKTTCVYGMRFGGSDQVVTAAQAIQKYGTSLPSHEWTTLVRHNLADANGSKFHCGHDGNSCKCYCSNKGPHHIWHRAPRHADARKHVLTQAGCVCATSCVAMTGTTTGKCNIVPGSCKVGNAVTAGSGWDTCNPQATLKTHYKVLVPTNYHL